MFIDADAYDRFMGRYSVQLAPQLADLAGVAAGMRVLDVGAGTGMLTAELVRRVGAPNVAACDPSPAFVEALRARYPDIDVSQGLAEELSYPDSTFDATLAQLVVHFMSDPLAGAAQMARVTRSGGVVAACVWDQPLSNASPLSLFWQAARLVDTDASAGDARTGTREGELANLLIGAGLLNVAQTELWVRLRHDTFEDWWAPFEEGTGPAGTYVATRTPEQLVALREAARSLVGETPFEITGRAWAARGVSPG